VVASGNCTLYNLASNVGGTLTFGFRYQPKDGGFLFKAALTPFFGLTKVPDKNYSVCDSPRTEPFFFPLFGGVSFGHVFR